MSELIDNAAKRKELLKHMILPLDTPFLPVPLIEMAREKGYRSWSETVTEDHVRTWFGWGVEPAYRYNEVFPSPATGVAKCRLRLRPCSAV